MASKKCELCGATPRYCECGHCDICDAPYNVASNTDHCIECGNCKDCHSTSCPGYGK